MKHNGNVLLQKTGRRNSLLLIPLVLLCTGLLFILGGSNVVSKAGNPDPPKSKDLSPVDDTQSIPTKTVDRVGDRG